MQVKLSIHPGTWWLVPFRIGRDVPGTFHGTWLCVTILASR